MQKESVLGYFASLHYRIGGSSDLNTKKYRHLNEKRKGLVAGLPACLAINRIAQKTATVTTPPLSLRAVSGLCYR